MQLSTKILITISVIVILCLFSFIIYKQIEISKQQRAIETEVVKQKELVDGITRSMSEYASKKDMEKFIKDNGVNLKAIQEDLQKLHAEIRSVNTITVVSNGYNGNNLPSSNTGPNNPNSTTNPVVTCNGKELSCPNQDQYGYLQKRQNLILQEPFGTTNVPFGEVGFSAWQPNPWNLKIFPRSYHVTSVVGVDENQRQYFYNKFTINVDGKQYDIKIDTAITKQEYPEAKLSWWNPRLFLTTGLSLNMDAKINGNIGTTIGFISYGKFKTTPIFSILQLGVGYQTFSNKPSLIINPFNFNIGTLISNGLINNTYIGPSIQLDVGSNTFIGINIGVGL